MSGSTRRCPFQIRRGRVRQSDCAGVGVCGWGVRQGSFHLTSTHLLTQGQFIGVGSPLSAMGERCKMKGMKKERGMYSGEGWAASATQQRHHNSIVRTVVARPRKVSTVPGIQSCRRPCRHNTPRVIRRHMPGSGICRAVIATVGCAARRFTTHDGLKVRGGGGVN